jgi:Flp pilus assembly protein TadG
MRRQPTSVRQGSILPLAAISLIALMGLLALGVDLGVVTVARTECQDAADAAALAGVRLINGNSANNNKTASETFAVTVATSNNILTQPIQSSQVTVQTGVYAYNTTSKSFNVDFSGNSGTNWTSTQVTISAQQPSYFGQVFGLGPFSVGATAIAVHRPRDVAIVLDFSTSMQYGSNTNIRGTTNGGATAGSINPDTVYPQFGPWSMYPTSSIPNPMCANSGYADRGGEGHALSNLTTLGNGGPPLVGDFLCDTSGSGSYVNAFVGASADASGWGNTTGTYSATQTPVVCPTPNTWTNHPAAGLDGDLWPFKLNLNPTNPQPSDFASTVQELLTGSNGAYANNTVATTSTPLSWDAAGYDYNPSTANYKTGYNPATPSTSTFKGYTLGPGYYGKTFYMWPPDSRTPVSSPGNSTYVAGDWRQRYFGTSDNSRLWDSNGNWIQNGGTINYAAVLAWLKSGPQALPPNLQSGRLIYYKSIPSDVNSGGTTSDTDMDKTFWKNYIDFVFGYNSYNQTTTLYGKSSGNSNGGTTFGATVQITPASGLTGNPKPYMNYNDIPIHPRLHFWFGPLTMIAFLTGPPEYARNWFPGTCHEAHCWHLKAGIQSAIQDIKNNHPNDYATLVYFSTLSQYNNARVPLGQKYQYMTNSLWYPYSLLDSNGNLSGTMRPYNQTFGDVSGGVVPNSNGGTNPTGGFMTAYNQFATNGRSGATKLVIYETDGVAHDYYDHTNYASGVFTFGSNVDEAVSTDITMKSKTEQCVLAGILCNPTSSPTSYTFANPDFSVTIPATAGFSTARSPTQIHAIGFGELFEPYLTSLNTATGNPASDMQKTAMKCLLYVQQVSGTSNSSDTIGSCYGFPGTATGPGGTGGYTSGPQSFKIIVGDYNTRIDLIRQALQRIMQSGVQVSLIQ